jgi:hypothetical protein
MMWRGLCGLAFVVVLIALAACGSEDGGDTTVIQEADSAPETQTVTETVETGGAQPGGDGQSGGDAPPSETEQPEPQGDPPDVVGLTLPAAKKALKAAGFTPDVSNTDTAFGIIVESNYTICKQSAPRGDLVPVLAQKYGC